MAGRRDDIVMRPRLHGSQNATTAKGRQKEARQLQLLDRQGVGLRSKLIAAQAVRRYYQNRRRAARARQSMRLGSRVARGLGVAGRGIGAAVSRTPWGLILSAIATAGAAVTSLATGRTFGQLALDAKRRLIGDLDLEAAAASQARRHVLSNQMLMRNLAATGDRTHASRIYKFHKERNLRRLKGRQLIESEIGVNTTADSFLQTRAKQLETDIRHVFGEDSAILKAARDFARSFRQSYKNNVLDKNNR